jgi:hypothetical protein
MGNENYSPYECAVINDEFTRESGRISGEIYSRLRETSPWIRLVKNGEFPNGMGNIINNLTFERTFNSTVEDDWTNVPTSDGADASACLPDVEDIDFGQTQRNFRLQHKAIEGPDLCIADLRTTYQVQKQLDNAVEQLTSVTGWVWENRYRNEYIRLAGRKYLARPNFPYSTGEGFLAGQEPTSKLTQGMLDKVYMQLIRDGAGQYAVGRANGRPVFGIILSAEASNAITFGNDAAREDIRWANPDWNLAPLGVDRSYRGWAHIIDPYPPRYNFDENGIATRVEVWEATATTKGNKFEIAADYETAEYEASIPFLPSVLKCLKPRPMSTAGGNTRFDPQGFMGDFRWLNIPDRKCNPDGTIGFHRGVFVSASEPWHPEHGNVILHKRCSNDLELANCTYS